MNDWKDTRTQVTWISGEEQSKRMKGLIPRPPGRERKEVSWLEQSQQGREQER